MPDFSLSWCQAALSQEHTMQQHLTNHNPLNSDQQESVPLAFMEPRLRWCIGCISHEHEHGPGSNFYMSWPLWTARPAKRDRTVFPENGSWSTWAGSDRGLSRPSLLSLADNSLSDDALLTKDGASQAEKLMAKVREPERLCARAEFAGNPAARPPLGWRTGVGISGLTAPGTDLHSSCHQTARL